MKEFDAWDSYSHEEHLEHLDSLRSIADKIKYWNTFFDVGYFDTIKSDNSPALSLLNYAKSGSIDMYQLILAELNRLPKYGRDILKLLRNAFIDRYNTDEDNQATQLEFITEVTSLLPNKEQCDETNYKKHYKSNKEAVIDRAILKGYKLFRGSKSLEAVAYDFNKVTLHERITHPEIISSMYYGHEKASLENFMITYKKKVNLQNDSTTDNRIIVRGISMAKFGAVLYHFAHTLEIFPYKTHGRDYSPTNTAKYYRQFFKVVDDAGEEVALQTFINCLKEDRIETNTDKDFLALIRKLPLDKMV